MLDNAALRDLASKLLTPDGKRKAEQHMVSGYEKSPDYGGRPPPKWFWVVIALVFFGVPAFVLFLASVSS